MKFVYAILLSLLLVSGCRSLPKSVAGDPYIKSAEARVEALKQLRSEYPDQKEWVTEVNETYYGYSSTWWDCYSALDCAMKRRSLPAAEYLLRSGATAFGKPYLPLSKITDLPYPIQRAVLKARSDKEAAQWLELLLKWGADPDSASREHPPALCLAIKRHFPTAVKVLLKWGASMGPVQAVDPPDTPSYVTKRYQIRKDRLLPMYSGALVFVALYAEEGNEADLQILKNLIEAGANLYDMRFVQYPPSFPGYVRMKGKSQLADYAVNTYARLNGFTSGQLENFIAELKQHDEKAANAKVESLRKKQAAAAYKETPSSHDFVDDSNTWADTATSVINNASRIYQTSQVQSQAPPGKIGKTAMSGSDSSGPNKTEDTSCVNSPHCKATSYSGPYEYSKIVTGTGRGYNNATACEQSRLSISAYHECNEFVNGKRELSVGMGVAYEPCECTELEFKSECRTRATVYCGDPDKGSGQGVRVE